MLIEKSKPRGEQAGQRGGGIEMPSPTGNIKQTTKQSSVEFGKDVLHTLIWELFASIWSLFHGTR